MFAFRQDPQAASHAKRTDRIFSERVAGFGYPDCPGHAAWNGPGEWLGSTDDTHPLHLLGEQPKTSCIRSSTRARIRSRARSMAMRRLKSAAMTAARGSAATIW